MTALLEKLRRVLHHRYTPFFLPVVGSLIYIGAVILFIPESVDNSNNLKGEEAEHESTAAPDGSASTTSTQDAASRAAKRRARLANRIVKKAGALPGVANTSPVVAHPAPEPPAPDNAE
jgi:hypothetical protein